MPLITKAARRVKKPAWQRGTTPPTKEQRDHFAIVANHEQKFTRAFTALLRDLITPRTLKIIRAAIRDGSTVEEQLAAMPFFDPSDPESFAEWEEFGRRMESTYELVIQESINNENRKRGWDVAIEKAEAPALSVNADAVEFIRIRSLTRVVDMSEKEKERVRNILTRGFESGTRPSEIVEEIQDTVGLTAFQAERLERKIAAARAAGMTRDASRLLKKREAKKLRLIRARTIARTETNDAMVRGLTESWKQAADEGLTPPETMKEWVAMLDVTSTGKPRTSPICRELDGQRVPIGQNFAGEAEGMSFEGHGPPAHPNCRSTLILIFPE